MAYPQNDEGRDDSEGLGWGQLRRIGRNVYGKHRDDDHPGRDIQKKHWEYRGPELFHDERGLLQSRLIDLSFEEVLPGVHLDQSDTVQELGGGLHSFIFRLHDVFLVSVVQFPDVEVEHTSQDYHANPSQKRDSYLCVHRVETNSQHDREVDDLWDLLHGSVDLYGIDLDEVDQLPGPDTLFIGRLA